MRLSTNSLRTQNSRPSIDNYTKPVNLPKRDGVTRYFKAKFAASCIAFNIAYMTAILLIGSALARKTTFRGMTKVVWENVNEGPINDPTAMNSLENIFLATMSMAIILGSIMAKSCLESDTPKTSRK